MSEQCHVAGAVVPKEGGVVQPSLSGECLGIAADLVVPQDVVCMNRGSGLCNVPGTDSVFSYMHATSYRGCNQQSRRKGSLC